MRKAFWLASNVAYWNLPNYDERCLKDAEYAGVDEVYMLFSYSRGSIVPSKVRPQAEPFKGKDVIRPLVKKFKQRGIRVHAWIVTLMLDNPEFCYEHKELYVVNKLGVSCVDKPPYISEYKWLCPARPKVVEFVVDYFLEVASHYDVDGLHFDYIRYPDVLLPVALRSKYEGVPKEDVIKPEFDHCYCSYCREAFRKEYGVDPVELKYYEYLYGKWFKWRADRITNLVKTVYKKVKNFDSELEVSAAVFATPKLAYEYVFQDWVNWGIDHYNPMIYTKFYGHDYKWVGVAVREAALKGVKVIAGISLHHVDSEEQLKVACTDAVRNGSVGACIFVYPPPRAEQLKWIREAFKAMEKE